MQKGNRQTAIAIVALLLVLACVGVSAYLV
jgi:hypothetical protein